MDKPGLQKTGAEGSCLEYRLKSPDRGSTAGGKRRQAGHPSSQDGCSEGLVPTLIGAAGPSFSKKRI